MEVLFLSDVRVTAERFAFRSALVEDSAVAVTLLSTADKLETAKSFRARKIFE